MERAETTENIHWEVFRKRGALEQSRKEYCSQIPLKIAVIQFTADVAGDINFSEN